MTVVEFFDRTSIENMVSCLAINPEKIILVGENKQMKKQETVYKRFLEKQNRKVLLELKSINKNSMEQMISVLTDIVETEEKCVFDLTGGEDLLLVAMGIVYERYKATGKIQMHRFNIGTGSIYDCDEDGFLPSVEEPKLSVADNIMLYGGVIVPYDGDKGTYPWVFDNDFNSDVRLLWEKCKENPGAWNTQITTFSFVADLCNLAPEDLKMNADLEKVQEEMENSNDAFDWNSDLIRYLCRYGYILDYSIQDSFVSFSFKNEQIKRCLTKAGTILELIVYLYANSITDKNGNKRYHDSATGVYIDWDASIHDDDDEEKDTVNEIDVILMKGLLPVFISCKNGAVDENELYKLDTVASKFGGKYARRVLVATYGVKSNKSTESHDYFVQRTIDMKIKLIENVHEMSEKEFIKELKNILS